MSRVYECRDCGETGAFGLEQDACEAGWQLLDLGDSEGYEGEPAVAMGEDWFCLLCAEERENGRKD